MIALKTTISAFNEQEDYIYSTVEVVKAWGLLSWLQSLDIEWKLYSKDMTKYVVNRGVIIQACTVERPYDVSGDLFEESYYDFLSIVGTADDCESIVIQNNF